MADFVKRVASIFLEDQQPKASLKQLTGEARKLYNELAKLPHGSKEFIAKSKEFQSVSRDLKNVREQINGTNGVFGQLTKQLGPLAGLMGVSFGGAAIIGGIKKSREEFLQHAKAVDTVTVALENNGRASGKTVSGLVNAADDFELNSLFKAEDILTGVTTKMLTFGNIAGEEFDRAQQAAIDWAATTQGDVSGAAQALGLALSNPEKGLTKLTRAGVVFSDEQKKVIQNLVDTGKAAEAQGIILDEFEKKFAGQAAAQAANEKGVRALDQAFGDLVEGGGGFFNAMIEDIAGSLAPMLRSLGDWLGVTNKQSEAANEQRVEMNALFNVLKAGNHTAEEQAQLVDRINKEYKDFLPTQISVTDSTEELEAAQRGANAAMLERIKLLAKQEILEDAQRAAVDAQKEALEAEIKLQEVQQGSISLWDRMKSGLLTNNAVISQNAVALDLARGSAEDAQAEYEKLVSSLGSVADAQKAVQDSMPSGDGSGLGPTPEEVEEATKRGEEIRQAIKDARHAMELDRLEGAAKEIEQVKDKYLKLAQESADSGVGIEEIEAAQAEEISAIREKYGKKEIERLNKLDADIRRITDEQRVARVAAENKAEVEAINERYRTAREAVQGNNAAIAELDRQQRAELIAVGEQQRIELQAANDEAELAKVREKYTKLQEEAKGNKDRLLQIDALLAFELEAKRDEQAAAAQERAVARQEALDAFDESVRSKKLEQIDAAFSLLEEQQQREFDLAVEQGENLDALRLRQQEERAELLAAQREAQLEELNTSFETMYALADEQGISTTELQRMHGEATALLKKQFAEQDITLNRDTDQKIIEGKKARRDAEMAVLNTIANGTRDLFTASGADASEMAGFEKAMTLFQIGIDTASAISSLTAMAEANPLNAVTGGAAGIAQFIAGFARITANVAKASTLLTAEQPAPPAFAVGGGTGPFITNYTTNSTSSSRSSSTSKNTRNTTNTTGPNVSRGGTVATPTLGWFGEAGPEYVAPNWMYSHPTLAPVFEHLEEIRTSGTVRPAFAEGGSTQVHGTALVNLPTGGGTGADSSAMLAMVAEALNGLTTQMQQGTLARVSTDQLEDTNERLTTIRGEAQLTN